MKTFYDKGEILERIKQSKRFTTDKELADFLGINKSTLSNWVKRNSIDYDLVFSKCEHIDLDWLLTGKKAQPKSQVDMLADSHEPYIALKAYKGYPLVGQLAVAGFGSGEFAIAEQDVKDYYIIPKFKNRKVDFMIEVSGSSMYPKYNSGDIVACRIIKESNFIQWNKVHVISTKEQGILVKRIDISEKPNHVTAISDNKDYRPFDIPEEEITGLAIVVGVIRLE